MTEDDTAKRLYESNTVRQRLHDALDHIVRVCAGSRQRTRRIRWIEARAADALTGSDEWKTLDLPKHDPGMEKLQRMIVEIFPLVKREIEALIDVYATEDDDGKPVIDDELVREDLAKLQRFVVDAKANVQVIREAEAIARSEADELRDRNLHSVVKDGDA